MLWIMRTVPKFTINLNGGTVELNGETTVTTGTTLNINSN